MGAVTNMRPDLFRGIIAEVPWMDVITDMYNTDLMFDFTSNLKS
jgi:oligopeptidase B